MGRIVRAGKVDLVLPRRRTEAVVEMRIVAAVTAVPTLRRLSPDLTYGHGDAG